ncbi:MAG TPA: hypothetical protein DHV96_10470 [Lachnospiraceae bacterium]|nr:hypothetical protein [Lachnospiraceae bacterium]
MNNKIITHNYVGYTENGKIDIDVGGDEKSLYLVDICFSDGNANPGSSPYWFGICYNDICFPLVDNKICVVAKNKKIISISKGTTGAYVCAYIIKLA